MSNRSRIAIVWSAGLVALSAAGLVSLALLAIPTAPALALAGGVTAGALAAQLIFRLIPSPPASSPDVSADRLRLLESAVIHAHDAVVVLEAMPKDGAGRSVLYVNDAFCTMTGYSREEVVGRSLYFLRGPDSDPATMDQIRQSLDNGQPLRSRTTQLPQRWHGVLGRFEPGACSGCESCRSRLPLGHDPARHHRSPRG